MSIQKISVLLLFQLGLGLIATGQICNGNLGENIFTEGDFGSGAANIPAVDPQIAPGYTYTTSPPPNDGFYTITNDISAWSYAFDWIEVNSDNSSDPQGYMMVVNASFEPGLFYVQEVDDLCDNTLYQFSVDIFNLLNPGSNGIRPNLSFLVDGVEVYNTGDVPENNQWNTYGFTFTTDPGQTSITFSLQNNAPGGQGNDIALDNISFRPCGPEVLISPLDEISVCEGSPALDLEANIVGDQYPTPAIQWQQSFDEGQSWVDIMGANDGSYTLANLAGGTYYFRYLLANGSSNLQNAKCRIVSDVKVVNVTSKFFTIVDTLCEGSSFVFGDNEYAETGIFLDSLTTATGCDSVVTLDLTFVPDPQIEPTFTVNFPTCGNESDGSIIIESIQNGTAPYTIIINDGLVASPGDIFDLPEGAYSYEIMDTYGCSFSTIIELESPDGFAVDVGPDLQVDLGEPVLITANFSQPAENLQWEPVEITDCTFDCETIEWVPSNSTTVAVTATSLSGCTASDSLFINVIEIRKIYIPNAFSPNLDGVNDFFTIYGDVPNVQRIEQLLILDRWGGVVFEQNDFSPNEVSQGWDGTTKGKILPQGNYAYFAKVLFLDGQVVHYEGGVNLIR